MLAISFATLIGASAHADSYGDVFFSAFDRIQRTALNGREPVEDLLASVLVSPESIALDLGAGRMYFTNKAVFDGEGFIQRAFLDGSGVETLPIADPGGAWALLRFELGSPVGLIRMMVQQSNCFIVVERGQAMRNMQQERALADSGQLREGSNIGEGQMVGADFILTPAVVFSDDNAGGVGGAVGGLLGRKNRFLGGVAGGVRFKEAQTSMLVSDARSGVQVAAAEGSARKADFNFGALLGGGGYGGAGGGYTSTDEGKIIAAGFADNYNQIVAVVKDDPNLQRDIGTLAEEAGTVTVAGEVFNEGDVVRPKIGNVKLMADPTDGAAVLATLARGEEMVYLGGSDGSYLQVETAQGGGWVKKALVKH